MRGMEVQSVGIASLSYDEKSQELINTRNEGAMLSDPSIAQGYMVKNMSEGVKNAGSNRGGAMQGFMGVGMGMSTMGNMMNGFTQMAQNNRPDGMNAAGNGAAGMAAGVASGAVQQEEASGWTCECGQKNTGKFCSKLRQAYATGEHRVDMRVWTEKYRQILHKLWQAITCKHRVDM